ncbi:hypothetical protein ACIBTW_28690 [Micromonospora parva]|uniref:hypothetical protein n=1 Tax=Micromonospora parva TaxID=1464048 RepID=UPI0037A6113B
MSSGTSYDWAYARERERERQAELRAELERLRVRHRQLRRLQAALATQGIRAALAEVADVAADADSTQLGIAVTEARTSLDALEARLEGAVAQRSQERAARWAATPAVANDLPAEPSLVTALAEDRARVDRTAVAALARAAADLAETEAARCVDDERAELIRLAERVGELDAVRARRALTDLESRVAASIGRRRDLEQAEQTRVELLTLAGELPQEERTALRQRVARTPDGDLAGLGDEVRTVMAAHRRRQARVEVTEQVLAALGAQGYELGESFDDLLAGGRQVTLLTSAKTPDYGVRLTVDPERDRLMATTVRRDDADDGDDQHAQQLVCDDLDLIEAELATGGLRLQKVLRRPVQPRVATMPARHWPAAVSSGQSAEAQRTEELRQAAEYERQRRANQQAKGRTS